MAYSALLFKPKKRSWITKVHASPWRTWETFKFAYHQQGDYAI